MQFFPNPDPIRAGALAVVRIQLDPSDPVGQYSFDFTVTGGHRVLPDNFKHRMTLGDDFEPELIFTGAGTGTLTVTGPRNSGFSHQEILAVEPAPVPAVADARVALVAPDAPASPDSILWAFIQQITNRLRFEEFQEFVAPRLIGNQGLEWFGTDAYRRLQRAALEFVETATDPVEAVLSGKDTVFGELQLDTVRAGIARSYVSSEGADLAQPFLRPTVSSSGSVATSPAVGSPGAIPPGSVASSRRGPRVSGPVNFPLPNVPFVELIWNYWLEEGMLVQTLNHILARFQNRRVGPGHDPLARFDLNPLLPLRNLLWGFAEDEVRRLTVRRRAAEYQYQYGLQLLGRAVPPPSHLVDRRTQFIEAFHALLNASYAFFKERDDKTVDADAFPLLSNLREVHLVLAKGANNQFADLAFTARAEMLSMQYIIALSETREFLGGPTMVPYDEPWMDRVDTMKTLQGWSDASVTHFFELATHGEQIVLSIRHGRWNEASRTRDDAANWALTWRNQIQRYVHAYRTVSGTDLATTVDSTMPSVLIARRLQRQLRA